MATSGSHAQPPPGTSGGEFEKEVVVPLAEEGSSKAAKLRRLFAQSFAIASADTERYLGNDPEKTIPMHPAEREDRRQQLAKKITGFAMEGLMTLATS